MFSIYVHLIFLVDCNQIASEMTLDCHQCSRNEVKLSVFSVTLVVFMAGTIMKQQVSLHRFSILKYEWVSFHTKSAILQRVMFYIFRFACLDIKTSQKVNRPL